ncbi:Flagellar hook-length control protein FliK [Mycobacterium tuberculosis]|nr:Flagellar hook-length control protein FliK [Mycobacterium tuberculosis]
MNIGGMIRGLIGETQMSEPKSLELKAGQVVKGKVVQLLSDKEALVQINGVQVRAQLETPLKQGEVTMLQVQPESPGGQVMLKPLQSSTVQIAEVSLGDVLKGVGLQDTPANRQLVQMLHQAGVPLTRENADAFAQLQSSMPAQMPPEDWVPTAVIAFQKGLPLTPETVASLRQAVQGPPFHKALENISLLVQQELDGQKEHSPQTRALLEGVRQLVQQVRETSGELLGRVTDGGGSAQGASGGAAAGAGAQQAAAAQGASGGAAAGAGAQQAAAAAQGASGGAAAGAGAQQAAVAAQGASGGAAAGAGAQQAAAAQGASGGAAAGAGAQQAAVAAQGASGGAAAGAGAQQAAAAAQGASGGAAAGAGAQQAAAAAQSPQTQPSTDRQEGGRLLGRLMKALGMDYEHQAIKHLEQTLQEQRLNAGSLSTGSQGEAAKATDSLKSALMQLSQATDAPQSLKDAAQQAVQHITGQQLLLSQDRGAMFSHVTLFVPLIHADGEQTAAIHIQSRKRKNGSLDESNCRLVFDLRMKALGDTMVDVQVVNRIVSLHVHNDLPFTRELLEAHKDDIAQGLNSIGYQFISMKCSPYPSRTTEALESSEASGSTPVSREGSLPSVYAQQRYKGVDIRV